MEKNNKRHSSPTSGKIPSEKKGFILIPARFDSTRFPGKPLQLILGKTMIQRVYENAFKSGIESYVVTDSSKIEEHVLGFGGKVLRVDDQVRTGTERILLAFKKYLQKDFPKAWIINLQGDEPLLEGQDVKKLYEFHQEHQSAFALGTLVKKRSLKDTPQLDQMEWEAYLSPQIVKAVFSPQTGECHYFSRSPVPHYTKDFSPKFWYQHVGVYSFSPPLIEFLMSEHSHKNQGNLDLSESLEQLKIMEAGWRIGATETLLTPLGVDNPEDILKVEGVLRANQKP
jgi:3-deoxy-manno-octulosonate cytidylyltransferase (CMP-KDO synthetase)